MLAHSYFSLRYGVVAPLEIAQSFKSNQFPVGLVADINSTSAVWDIRRWSQKESYPLLTGVDFKNKLNWIKKTPMVTETVPVIVSIFALGEALYIAARFKELGWNIIPMKGRALMSRQDWKRSRYRYEK